MSRFDFLYSDFKALYDKCVQAEEATDLNFKMLVVRQSLEYIVRELGERGNDLFQSISNLSDRNILDEEISDLFHETCMFTNRGVHGQSVSTYDIQTAINNLVDITIWYAAKHKKNSFRLNQFSAEDIGRAKQYIRDDSFQEVSQAEYLAVDVDPLATVGTFQTTWDETVNPLEKDVFETEAEYEKRIAQMEPVRIGYGVLNTEKKDGYTDVQFLQHHIEENKMIQLVKAPVYFFAQNAPASGVIDGEVVARLRVHDHKVYCDYSRIYLRNGEQDIPIRFICWQKTDYETDADYRKRVEALPVLPLGLCMPIRSRYDIEKQQLPFETKKFAYVPFAIPSIYTIPCDRDLAKRVCMQKEPFIVFGNILLNKTMERTLIWGKETGIVYDNEVVLSLNSLGIRHYNEENYIEAVKCFHQAAEKGYAAAQNNLGDCYQYGAGVQEDDQEAVKWYRKAAEQGNVDAQYKLGECYYCGDGVQQDDQEAIKWYHKSAEQGNSVAQNNLGDCYYNGDGIQQDQQEAVKWYRKAARQGNVDAQYNLGYCYENGHGVEQDYKEAVKWYHKAAEQGNTDAQYDLGYCYENGYGVEQDYTKAVKWYRKAAENGHSLAERELGDLEYFLEQCEEIE